MKPRTEVLHIVNGDCTLHLLQQSVLSGAMFPGDDILMEGPTRNCLRDGSDWHLRADYLATHFNIPAETYRQRVAEREQRLLEYSGYDEVVLWLEEDLFCQINLLFLLDWFAQHDLGQTRLSLICPAEERLGGLSPEQLAQLFETREVVTSEKLQFACNTWAAYCAPEPTAVEEFLKSDFDVWPTLKDGFENQVMRFPSTRNGLNYIENVIINQLRKGPLSFAELFKRANYSYAATQLGIGNMQLAAYVADLNAGDIPLLHIENFDGSPQPEYSGDVFRQWNISITETRREVAVGKRDWLQLKPINRWLGGAHLTPENVWRWERERSTLVRN